MSSPLLVSNLTNLRYLTGVEMTAGLLLLKGEKKTLFVDERYMEKAKEKMKRMKKSKKMKRTDVQVRHIDELPKHMKRLKRVRFEAEDVTVARLKRWRQQFRGTKFRPSEGAIEKQRRRKDISELRLIGRACRITDRVMQAAPGMLRAGHTEKSIAWEIEKMSRELGADASAFPTIVAFGENSSKPHHSPTHRRLRKGDIVQIDMGVKVGGYCSDCSRVFFTGNPTEEQKIVHALLLNVVKECTKKAKAGVSNRALDKHAREMLRSSKLGTKNQKLHELFLHPLGHGLGIEIHEGVNLSRKAKETKLLTNETITIEPGIYLAGEWGMRIEDTIVVNKTGGMPLTRAAKNMIKLSNC
jgi:Xaa-Pro aminopeptidase